VNFDPPGFFFDVGEPDKKKSGDLLWRFSLSQHGTKGGGGKVKKRTAFHRPRLLKGNGKGKKEGAAPTPTFLHSHARRLDGKGEKKEGKVFFLPTFGSGSRGGGKKKVRKNPLPPLAGRLGKKGKGERLSLILSHATREGKGGQVSIPPLLNHKRGKNQNFFCFFPWGGGKGAWLPPLRKEGGEGRPRRPLCRPGSRKKRKKRSAKKRKGEFYNPARGEKRGEGGNRRWASNPTPRTEEEREKSRDAPPLILPMK